MPANLGFTAAMVLVGAVALALTRVELGLRGEFSDTLLPAAIVAVFGLVVFALARSRHARLIADKRVAGLRGNELAFHVLVRIPLGTAVTEEVVFRGVLFAAWRAAGMSSVGAAACTSIAFGLWHIAPTIIGVKMNDADASRQRLVVAILGAVVLTTIVGLGLTWLRLETGGLIAPVALHAGVNSVGAFAAVKASRTRTVPS